MLVFFVLIFQKIIVDQLVFVEVCCFVKVRFDDVCVIVIFFICEFVEQIVVEVVKIVKGIGIKVQIVVGGIQKRMLL